MEIAIGQSTINSFAFESGFKKRNGGKTSPSAFLCSFCMNVVNGNFAISKCVITLSSILSVNVSKQALWKKINSRTVSFFLYILQTLISKKMGLDKVVVKEMLTFFPRILVQDSTVIPLHKSLFKFFPGSSNQTGATSSLKIQAVYNILNSSFIFFDITSFRKNDQSAAPKLNFIEKGDLLIRDLGYFSSQSFRKIIEMNAFFLSRLKYGVSIFYINEDKSLNLLELLKEKNTIDINIKLGSHGKLPVRLVGEKLPDDVAAKRRREYRNNRDQKLNPSKEHLEMLGWNLFITNIPSSIWSTFTVVRIYSLRWRIEIIFKSWKSCLNFDFKNQRCSPDQIRLMIYARLIVVTLVHTNYFSRFNAKVIKIYNRQLSLLKFMKLFAGNPDRMLELFETSNTREQKILMDLLIKNVAYEKRKRLNYVEKMLCLDKDQNELLQWQVKLI